MKVENEQQSKAESPETTGLATVLQESEARIIDGLETRRRSRGRPRKDSQEPGAEPIAQPLPVTDYGPTVSAILTAGFKIVASSTKEPIWELEIEHATVLAPLGARVINDYFPEVPSRSVNATAFATVLGGVIISKMSAIKKKRSEDQAQKKSPDVV